MSLTNIRIWTIFWHIVIRTTAPIPKIVFVQNYICSKLHLFKITVVQNCFCSKLHLFKITLVQNGICSKLHLFKIKLVLNYICSSQARRIWNRRSYFKYVCTNGQAFNTFSENKWNLNKRPQSILIRFLFKYSQTCCGQVFTIMFLWIIFLNKYVFSLKNIFWLFLRICFSLKLFKQLSDMFLK